MTNTYKHNADDVEKVAEYLWEMKREHPFVKTWCSWNGNKQPLFKDKYIKQARSLLASLNLKSEQEIRADERWKFGTQKKGSIKRW